MTDTIIIFGASGDLTSRKLVPALYRLFIKNRLPAGSRIVGVSRSHYEHQQWRDSLRDTTAEFVGDQFTAESWQAFSENVYYQAGDIQQRDDFDALAKFLRSVEPESGCGRVYYLSTMPQLYDQAIQQLGAAGLADDSEGYRRVIIEKPFGTDLSTAQALNQSIHGVFREDQIYRIDHYLGKETVQNIFALRFANSIFEPIWNRNYVDHVQITVAEEVVIGRRAGYYDKSGILRDMFQNHILQLMMITAMEPPARYDSSLVRDEKVKVLHSVRKMTGGDFASNTFRGQYDGYLDEEGVPRGSETETFSILKLYCDNWRWQGVPFYLRSGKGMSCRTTQIVIQFKQVPHILFGEQDARAARQSVGDSSPAGRGHPIALRDQGARFRNEDAHQHVGLQLSAVQRRRVDAGCLSTVAARFDPRRCQSVRTQRRSRIGVGNHRPDHRRLEKSRRTGAVQIRNRLVGPDRSHAVDAGSETRMVRCLSRHQVA